MAQRYFLFKGGDVAADRLTRFVSHSKHKFLCTFLGLNRPPPCRSSRCEMFESLKTACFERLLGHSDRVTCGSRYHF
jgi:hypothetical protein